MNMLNPFVCGSFHDEDQLLASPCSSSPKKSKRKDNPYSSRGLDKFSELLADLDEKRQKIYSQMNPHDISFVRFVYSNSDDFVPVVVKVKKNDKDQKNHKGQEQQQQQQLRVLKARTFNYSESMNKSSSTESSNSEERKQQPKMENVKKDEKFLFWNVKKWDIGKPSFYLPLVVILILFFLSVFGRSVATLLTCVLWYAIPILKSDSDSSNSRGSMKIKKDYGRRLSEKKVVVMKNEETKKKDYVRWVSEKKIEGTKKKDYVRGWSEKKMNTEGLVISPTSGNFEDSKNMIQGKHSHKKSW